MQQSSQVIILEKELINRKQHRLVKKAKPRKKKKELKLTTKFVFEVFSDNENEAKIDIKAFRTWMKDVFPEWSETILQHFLYQNGLSQNSDDKKYLLAVNIDKIIKDESSIKDERIWFDTEIDDINADVEEDIKKKEKELFEE